MKDLSEVVEPYDAAIAALEEAEAHYRETGLAWVDRELAVEDLRNAVGQIANQRRHAVAAYQRHAEAVVASGPRSPVARTALVVIPGGGAA